MPEPIRAVSVRRLNVPSEDAPVEKATKSTANKSGDKAASSGQKADPEKEN